MSRPIKFRAWTGQQMQLVYDMTFTKKGISCRVSDNPKTLIDPPIMQFTGLQDKNGTDIYEGDILEYRSEEHEPEDDGDRYIVGWHRNGFAAAWTRDPTLKNAENDGLKGGTGDVEVIGNIYEHPQLLEETKE